MSYTEAHSRGFTLVEILVGTAVFLVVATAAYSAYVSLLQLANASQAKILGVELADEQFEIIRNMPYINVGLTNDTIETPYGILPPTQTLTRGGFTFTVDLVVQVQNLSTSTVQASSKLVEVDVTCPTCQNFQPVALTGQVSPANLQSAGNGGAITVQVADSSGNVIQGAIVTVQSDATSTLTKTGSTDNNGTMDVIGAQPGYQVYHITATKSGYSTDQTSPDITVNQGQLASVNLTIDRLSTLNISSVSPTCQSVPDFHFKLAGSKQFSQNLATDGTGNLTLDSMLPDTYTLTSVDSSNDAGGITPFSPFLLLGGSTQSEQIVAVPVAENSLLITVENAQGLPVAGASVTLSGSNYDQTLVTGQGFIRQDWSSNDSYSPPSYGIVASSGNAILQQDVNGNYNTNASSSLESITFDTGTTSNFYALKWDPVSQPQSAGTSSVGFWIATAPSSSPSGPWNYLGPDGTANSYYSSPGMAISSANNSGEFLRYYMFLSTATSTVTPNISDVSVTYTSGCLPPGQVLFQNIPGDSNNDYSVSVTYGSQSANGTVSIPPSSGWHSLMTQPQ